MMSYMSTVQCLSPCPARALWTRLSPQLFRGSGSGSYLILLYIPYKHLSQDLAHSRHSDICGSWKADSTTYQLCGKLLKHMNPIHLHLSSLSSWHTGANSAFEGQLHYCLVVISSCLPEYLPYWLSIFFFMYWNFPISIGSFFLNMPKTTLV